MLRTIQFALFVLLAPLHAQEHAWTGELRPEGGAQTVRPADVPASLEDVAARLSDVQLTLEAERDFEGARTDLEELWMQVARLERFPDQAEALVRVALERSELLEKLGELEAASAAVAKLLPTEGLRTASGEWLTEPAGEELRRVVAKLRSDARIVARLAALEAREHAPETNLAARPHFADPLVRAYVEEHFGLPSVEMDQLVQEQMEISFANVQHLGIRAAPTLAGLTLSDTSGALTSATLDPLELLLHIDPLGGAILVADHLDVGGGPWRLRIFEHLPRLNNALEDRPEWGAILTTLFRDSQWSSRVFPRVKRLYHSGVLYTPLVETLSEQAANPGSTSRSEVFQLLAEYEDPRQSARPVYVAALSHPDKGLRTLGAQHLLNLEAPAPELRRFASSTDSEERGWALSTLLDSKDSLDASERRLLLTFLEDPDSSLRRRAVSILSNQREPFAAEVYLALAGDDDPMVLRELALLQHTDRATQAALLLRLADSDSPTVLAAIDHRLINVDWLQDEVRLPVLEKRFVDPVNPFPAGDPKGFQLQSYLSQWVANKAEGRRACVRMGLASGREEPLHAALRASYGNYPNSGRKYPNCEALVELEPARIADFFDWAHRVDLDVAAVLMEGFAKLEGTPVEPFEELARDLDVRRLARIHATHVVVAHAPGRGESLVQELLHEDSWGSSPPHSRESQALQSLAEALPNLSDLAPRVLDDSEILDPVALAVAAAMPGYVPLTDELALRILDRWLTPGIEEYVVEASLAHLETMDPKDVDPELVIRAAYLPAFAEPALRAMGSLQHPEYLPILERVLQGRQYLSPEDANVDRLRERAITSLTRYLSDDAARILVEGLSQASAGVANKIREALTVIREYHEERTYWERQSEALPSRDEAVGELLAMLDAPEDWVRAEAVKGLASLGALEAIPRLIRLKGDESEAVMGAAGRALDRLFALAEREQASAAGD